MRAGRDSAGLALRPQTIGMLRRADRDSRASPSCPLPSPSSEPADCHAATAASGPTCRHRHQTHADSADHAWRRANSDVHCPHRRRSRAASTAGSSPAGIDRVRQRHRHPGRLHGHRPVLGYVDEMRYFTGPEVPGIIEPGFRIVERWYIKAALESDPAFGALADREANRPDPGHRRPSRRGTAPATSRRTGRASSARARPRLPRTCRASGRASRTTS